MALLLTLLDAVQSRPLVLSAEGSELRLFGKASCETPTSHLKSSEMILCRTQEKIDHLYSRDRRFFVARDKWTVVSSWFATLEDVRTFFRKNPTSPTFKDVLVKARDALAWPR